MFFFFGKNQPRRPVMHTNMVADTFESFFGHPAHAALDQQRERSRRNQAEIEAFLREGRQRAAHVCAQAVIDAWRRSNAGEIAPEERNSLSDKAFKEFHTAWETLKELAKTRYNVLDVMAASGRID